MNIAGLTPADVDPGSRQHNMPLQHLHTPRPDYKVRPQALQHKQCIRAAMDDNLAVASSWLIPLGEKAGAAAWQRQPVPYGVIV